MEHFYNSFMVIICAFCSLKALVTINCIANYISALKNHFVFEKKNGFGLTQG